MKILLIGLVDYTKVSGGVIHQSALANNMLLAGHSVALLAPATGEFENLRGAVRACLVPTPSMRRLGLPASLETFFQVPEILRQVRKNRPDAIYLRNNLFTCVIGMLGRVFNIPVITEHNSWQAIERLYIGRARQFAFIESYLQALDCKLSTACRTVTAGIRDLLIDSGCNGSSITVIGNGADPETFRPLARESALAKWALDPALRYVGFIGSLIPWHGVHHAIDAMRAISKRCPNVRLLIFGDGPERGRLEQLMRHHALEGRVRFFGSIKLADANEAINCFDIAIAPFSRQLYEKVGVATIKLGDYMAAGRPLVASDLPGLRELGSTGWPVLVPPDNPDELAHGIERLINDPAELVRRGTAGRAAAEGPLSWQAITARVVTLIEDTIRTSKA
ncbi:MAG: glycosyltransferase family 1 protein [Gammaproteobacteria bacterium]|nr:glycosyltransferase family 1 protein [Gammaproteobacteria bacterium]